MSVGQNVGPGEQVGVGVHEHSNIAIMATMAILLRVTIITLLVSLVTLIIAAPGFVYG